MIEKTIGEIEANIRDADSVSAERKAELLKLLGTLKSEVGKLSKTHDEHAQSIAGFHALDLLRVAAKHDARAAALGQLQQLGHLTAGDHGGFIDDQHFAGERELLLFVL